MSCLIIITAAKALNGQQFMDILRLKGADRFLATRSRGSYFFETTPLILTFIQFVASSLLIYFIYCLWKTIPVRDHLNIYFYILLGYTSFEILKIVLERSVGYLLDIYKKMRPYFYKKITMKSWIGLFLFSGCFFVVFSPLPYALSMYTLIGIAVLIYVVFNIWLLRLYSELVLRFPFYFILYFCTLEIAPYFILYKYVTRL